MAGDLRELLEEMTKADLAVERHPERLEEIALVVPHGIKALPAPRDERLSDFNCVMYALDLVGMFEDPSGRPFGRFYADTEFLLVLVKAGHLVANDETEGAVVTWSHDGILKHVGLVKSPGQAVSKWGIGHLYEHGYFEVPTSYGSEVAFFKPLSSDHAFELLKRHYRIENR